MPIRIAVSIACACITVASQTTVAQQPGSGRGEATFTQDETWSYEQNNVAKPDPRSIIQQKAQIRAAQRMKRMASMQWYGMSNARPTASATPFTTMYSPAWQMPGGRPFAWFHSQRSPVIIMSERSPVLIDR